MSDLVEGSPRVAEVAEWEVRVALAALYRLVALHGWDDAIFTHISARVPGPDHHFLINPYGLFFEEITASSLVKVGTDGKVVSESPYRINPAGFTIHSAVHMARPDVTFVIHLHAAAGVAVAAQAEGLLPLSQHALIVLPNLAYHDYEGIALNLDERERIVADLGDRSSMILRNHGTLSVGGSAAEAWLHIYYLEMACQQQIDALSGGRDRLQLAPIKAQEEVRAQVLGQRGNMSALVWPGLLRRLDRHLPGYAA
ncbi:class II aldolase/adducin family protein [Sphingomonas oligophenolica]|uniref:Class II aldolase/adducin family protein n=1 Tax=Sphingomonas oligophenolica TaxID=301154 RepID=A0ABU9Y8R6_9SPHN